MPLAMSTKLQRAQEFLEWFKQQGGYLHPSAELRDDEHMGLSLFTTAPIPNGQRLLSCPFSAAVTAESAASAISMVTGVPATAMVWPSEVNDGGAWSVRMLVAAYVGLHWVYEDKGESPKALAHSKYIASLPGPAELVTPLYFSEAERQLLAGTNLSGAVVDREREWKAESEAVRTVLKEDGLTWERYLVAATYLSSRSFPDSLLNLPNVGSETVTVMSSSPALIPGLDLLNPPISSGDGPAIPAVSAVSSVELKAEEQIFNNYGAKSNEELLLAYGMVLPQNPNDTLGLRLGALPPPTQAKLKAHGLDGTVRFEIDAGGDLPKPLLQTLRVVLGDDHHGHDHQHNDDDSEGEDDEHAEYEREIEELQLEAEVLGVLGDMLEQKLQRLQTVQETDGGRPEVANMITQYRQGQVAILNATLDKLGERVERVESLLEEGPECPCGC